MADQFFPRPEMKSFIIQIFYVYIGLLLYLLPPVSMIEVLLYPAAVVVVLVYDSSSLGIILYFRYDVKR